MIDPEVRPATPEQVFARVFRELKPRGPLPEIRVEFRPFADARNWAQLRQGLLTVRLSDLLGGAPAAVVESLAYVLIGKLLRRPVGAMHVRRYRSYLNRRDMQRQIHLVRQLRGRKFLSGAQGQHHDLAAVFEELNRAYFDGLMARPQLSWSRRASRNALGHYDPSHNAIIISRVFDRADVPRLALEYVLFHEMLHLRYPAEARGARRSIHTRAFREAERQFTGLAEAKALLKALPVQADSRRARPSAAAQNASADAGDRLRR